MPSPKGFVEWEPQKSVRHFFDEVLEVIDNHRDSWPETQRRWLYFLKSEKGWLKVDEYGLDGAKKEDRHLCTRGKNLNNFLVMGRRSGKIPWEAVAAGRGLADLNIDYRDSEDLADSVECMVANAQFNRQSGQHRKVVLWCESEGLTPKLEDVARHYGADLMAGKGFDVVGRKYEFAERIAELGNALILHVGDLDESGDDVHVSLLADINAYCEVLGGHVELRRVGLLEEQVTEMGLEYACTPLKQKSAKSKKSNHGGKFTCDFECELDAMNLYTLIERIEQAFEEEFDMELFNERLAHDKAERLRTLDVLRERLS